MSGAGDESQVAVPAPDDANPMRSRTYLAVLVGVFVAGLVLRLWVVFVARPTLASDARDYDEFARNLLAGRGYMQVYEGETETFNGFTFRAFRAPGYPALLAGLYGICGWHPRVALLANIVADAITQVVFVLIALRLLGRPAAVVVLTLLAVNVLWVPSLTSECTYAALFALLCLLLVTGTPWRSARGALGTGLLLAAALFTRPITVCFAPVLLWQAARPARRAPDDPARADVQQRWRRLAIVLLPAVVGLALWGARNYAMFGRLVLFTTNGGHHNAWDYGLHADAAFAALRAQGLNEAEIDAALRADQRAQALADPVGWLKLWGRRVGELFTLAPPPELTQTLWTRTFDTGTDGSPAGRVYRALYYANGVTYALAAAGLVALLLRRRTLGGLGLLLAAYVLIHAAVSRGDVRLAAPLYPVLCLLAGGLIGAAWRFHGFRPGAPGLHPWLQSVTPSG